MRHLGLGHNLGGAKRTVSRHFGGSEADRGSASAALNFERISRNRRQLLGPEFEIFFVGALLNFGGIGRNRLAASAVGAREATVERLENQICRAPWTLIPMDLLRR